MAALGRSCALAFLLVVVGCERKPATPVGTGAKETIENYHTALIQQDWSKAYSYLDAESQRRYPEGEFRRLAEKYRRNLGFEPETVTVQSCDEHDAEAIAHVAFVGKAASRQKRYKDGCHFAKATTCGGSLFHQISARPGSRDVCSR